MTLCVGMCTGEGCHNDPDESVVSLFTSVAPIKRAPSLVAAERSPSVVAWA
jgi:hypothetical protein